ncbi:MAG: hypothetical protein MJA30_03740 [Cytophagales bacterium]|nr:hypothetical protein [Cytophagales bacterium]
MRLTVLLFLLVKTTITAGQSVYTLHDSTDQHIFVYDFITYLEDTEGRLDATSILKGELDDQFIASTDFTPKNYHLGSTYWLKVKIRHNSQSGKNWLLEFFDQTIDNITAFIPSTGGNYDRIHLGDTKVFDNRRFKHKNFIIPLKNDHNQELTYYFKVKAQNPVNIIMVLRSYDFFTYYSLNEYFFFGIFCGLIILTALYNLLLYFAIREIPYLYFVIYALSVALFFGSSEGFAYQFVWPGWPWWNSVAYGVFMYLVVLSGILFTQQFLHLASRAPRTNMVLNGLIAARSLYFLTCVVFFPTWFDYLVVDLIPLVILTVIAIYFFRRGYQPARLLMLAFVILFTGGIIKLMLATEIGNIGSSAINYYSIHLAFLLQLVTLSFALGDKVRIIKNKKDRAMRRIVAQHEVNSKLQTKVNRELEQKVRERTLELDIKNEALKNANQRLEEQAEEINKMNQLLDKDNWNLKKESKLEMRKRLLSKGVSYAEFKEIFPGDISCYQYLALLKWQKGFECRKCHYHKAIDLPKFSKRCSRCGSVESATSHTVFHNTRFPIDKAFYMAHLEISGIKMTLKEVSEILDLRMATCSGFRKKVRKALLAPGVENASKDRQFLMMDPV